MENFQIGYTVGSFISVPLVVQTCRRIQPLLFADSCLFGFATLIAAFAMGKIFKDYADIDDKKVFAQLSLNLLCVGTATLISLLVAQTLGMTLLVSTAAKITYLSNAGGFVGGVAADFLGSKAGIEGSTT